MKTAMNMTAKMTTKMTMKRQLQISMIAIGLIPVTIATMLAYYKAKVELKERAAKQAESVGDGDLLEVKAYFNELSDLLVEQSVSPYLLQSMIDFDAAFQKYDLLPFDTHDSARVETFYKADFTKAFREKSGDPAFSGDAKFLELDQLAKNAQFDFIAANENQVGEKHKLDAPRRASEYARVHSAVHPALRSFLERHALYDMMLINPSARVVYTVFKEVDFAQSLEHTLLKGSGLERAFRGAQNLKSGEFYFDDYAAYGPSYNQPASFLSAPLYKGSLFVGAIVFQVPINKISEIAMERSGLGQNGQTLIFGQDGKLRVDAFRSKELYNVAASFAGAETSKMSFPALTDALSGKFGNFFGESYDGLTTITHAAPFKIGTAQWIILTELDEAEVMVGLRHLSIVLVLFTFFAVSTIGIFATVFAGRLGSKLERVIKGLTTNMKNLSASAQAAEKSSSGLSSATTEQASSLQETMASIEEISAMVAQNAESAQKASDTVSENAKSTVAGAQGVDEMIEAMRDIKTTNEEILLQMEESNREFGQIVKIISEIGLKTKVINDIVFQTKLLSFNASVEAARAGEHGKGFAVVAEEVGNLAQMSGNAAKEITAMLGQSIKSVNEIVEGTKLKVDRLVEVGRDKVDFGQSVAERCKMTLDEISRSAAVLKDMVGEIAQASHEQAKGVQEINVAVTQLDQVTQTNASLANQSSQESVQLRKETEDLQESLNVLSGILSGTTGANMNAGVNQFGKNGPLIGEMKVHSGRVPHEALDDRMQVVNKTNKNTANHASGSSNAKAKHKVNRPSTLASITDVREQLVGQRRKDGYSTKQPERFPSPPAEMKLVSGGDVVPVHDEQNFEDF
jgi:methyl-accepting chemotaxis protein